MAKKKMITREGTLDGIVSDAFGTFQTLRDEIAEWRDNLESNGMEHLPKYEQVSECADALDGFCDEEPTMPETTLGEMTLKWEESGRKKSNSRASRLSDAVEDIRRVVEHIQEYLEAHQDDPIDEDGAWDQYASDLQNAIDEAEAVEFPGMFG